MKALEQKQKPEKPSIIEKQKGMWRPEVGRKERR